LKFIVLAPNEWEGQWMNRQQLFSRIGKQHDVIYSTGTFSYWGIGKERHNNSQNSCVIEDIDNISVFKSSKFLCRLPKINLWNRLVIKFFSGKLNRWKKQEQTCLYIFHPKYFKYIDHIKHDHLVYHLYDDISMQAGYHRYKNDDMKMLNDANTIFCSSQLLTEKISEISNRKDITFLPNGVDFSSFSSPVSMPIEYKKISGLKVTYSGSINEKVDLKLLLELAIDLPNINFVLVGQVKTKSLEQKLVAALENKPNIYLVGFKPKEEMVGFIQHSDLNIMIYKTDDSSWSKYIYPLKMHEYLATGKPVLSSDIDAVREYEDVIKIAKNKEEWKEFILSIVVSEKESNKRKKVAFNNDWEARVDSLFKKLEETDIN
jgi:glycosyltransferase involved in cell wall biosynthesis